MSSHITLTIAAVVTTLAVFTVPIAAYNIHCDTDSDCTAFAPYTSCLNPSRPGGAICSKTCNTIYQCPDLMGMKYSCGVGEDWICSDPFSVNATKPTKDSINSEIENVTVPRCQTHADCPPEDYCHPVANYCYARNPSGTPCRFDYTCLSNKCDRQTSTCAAQNVKDNSSHHNHAIATHTISKLIKLSTEISATTSSSSSLTSSTTPNNDRPLEIFGRCDTDNDCVRPRFCDLKQHLCQLPLSLGAECETHSECATMFCDSERTGLCIGDVSVNDVLVKLIKSTTSSAVPSSTSSSSVNSQSPSTAAGPECGNYSTCSDDEHCVNGYCVKDHKDVESMNLTSPAALPVNCIFLLHCITCEALGRACHVNPDPTGKKILCCPKL